MHLHRVGGVDQGQGMPLMPRLPPWLPSTDHPLALGVGLDAWTIRRGRLAAVVTVRAPCGAQRRVLRPQRRVRALHTRHAR